MLNTISRKENILSQATNNSSILEKAEHFFRKCITKLRSDSTFIIGDLIEHVRRIKVLMKERLEVGAESYGDEVPITEEDLFRWEEKHQKERDNLSEGLEEQLDGIVYLVADYLKPIPEVHSREQKEEILSYKNDLQKAIGHLVHSTFYLLSAMKKRP
jgi:hypothetical protein